MRTVTLIGAPTSVGGYAPGQEDGPRALLDAGLVERLEAAGVEMRRGGQVKKVAARCLVAGRSLPSQNRTSNGRSGTA